MSDFRCNNGHDFRPLKSGYYKQTGVSGPFGPLYDQSVAYASLYCARCGETKEVIHTDHRRQS